MAGSQRIAVVDQGRDGFEKPLFLMVLGRYWISLEEGLVPGAGIEPAQPQWPRDFKSLVSTCFTIRAQPDILHGCVTVSQNYAKLCRAIPV